MNLEQVRTILNDITLPEGTQIRSANHPEGRMFVQIYQETICNRLVSLTEMAGGSGI